MLLGVGLGSDARFQARKPVARLFFLLRSYRRRRCMPTVFVYAGALDGKLRILDAASGEILRTINTNRNYTANNGIQAHGGAIDLSGVVVDGDRFVCVFGLRGCSGKCHGNVLLAYSLSP